MLGDKRTFGSALERPVSSVTMNTFAADERIKFRYDFYLTLLKKYAKYSQEIEGQNRENVIARVSEVANTLIERYKFGAKFTSDLMTYVESQFQETRLGIRSAIQNESGLSDDAFGAVMQEFKRSGLNEKFSPRFKMML